MVNWDNGDLKIGRPLKNIEQSDVTFSHKDVL